MEQEIRGEDEPRFAFGRNWQRYLAGVTEERLEAARQELAGMLEVEDLAGKSFLDIGSGSGIHSLAAARLGARVTSFDFDAESVRCTEEVRARHGEGFEWTVEEGSILDDDFAAAQGVFDVVYSWGVLHHTGDQWHALENAMGRVADGGRLFIALYNDQGGASRRWRAIKRAYVGAPRPLRWCLVVAVGAYFEAKRSLSALLRLRNPLPFRRSGRRRGMSVWNDLVDWVGGYPFEVSKPEEVFEACRARGFRLRRLRTCGGGLGCNEFVFEKTGEPEAPLSAPVDREAGHVAVGAGRGSA